MKEILNNYIIPGSRSCVITLILLSFSSCITKFIPEVNEKQELLVIEGLITDGQVADTVKISTSFPLAKKADSNPVYASGVWITDDLNNTFNLFPAGNGIYVTSPSNFVGTVGRQYKLHVRYGGLTYESYPMEMRAVPPMDSIYYQKVTITPESKYWPAQEGAQLYLSTHDPENKTRFYRWNYSETWEIRIPYGKALNKFCWQTVNSSSINIKSTSALEKDVIIHYPINYITNQTDRLKNRYSILINQYSLNEEEYLYWEKLRAVTQNVGGLYDVTPAAIPNNIYCVEFPSQVVLGYFSVSAKRSMRKFISGRFEGVVNPYTPLICVADTLYTADPPAGLNNYVWILDAQAGPCTGCPWMTITYIKGCADCTVRGTSVKPSYWP